MATSALRSSLRMAPASRFLRPAALPARQFSTFQALKAASSVAGQPGSKNISEVKENAKQEAKSVTSDIAKAISGGNDPNPVSQGQGGSMEEMQHSVTSLTGLAQTVPREAWLFGAAGFLPYMGTSLSTIYLARQVNQAQSAGANSTIDLDTALALLHHVELIQISYGAVILSFLGALHWGFEFASYNGRKGMPRYLMGVFPVLIGWPTLLLPAMLALPAQWAAFTAVWYTDSRATARGWTPKWFSTYRFALTAIVGTSIILTVGATNYYSAGASGTAAEKLARVKSASSDVKRIETEENASPRVEGKVGGDFSTEPGQDAYVVFENETKKAEEEEKKREEEEEAKKKENEEKAKAKKSAAEEKARAAKDKAEGKA